MKTKLKIPFLAAFSLAALCVFFALQALDYKEKYEYYVLRDKFNEGIWHNYHNALSAGEIELLYGKPTSVYTYSFAEFQTSRPYFPPSPVFLKTKIKGKEGEIVQYYYRSVQFGNKEGEFFFNFYKPPGENQPLLLISDAFVEKGVLF